MIAPKTGQGARDKEGGAKIQNALLAPKHNNKHIVFSDTPSVQEDAGDVEIRSGDTASANVQPNSGAKVNAAEE